MALDTHKARQRARIIEATLRVIYAEGLSRVTISRVSTTAGVTRQTIYNYFPDVDSIISQALDEHSKEMEMYLLKAIGLAESLHDKLQCFAELQISHVSPEHEAFALHSGLSPELRARLDDHARGVKSALEASIIAGQRSGEVPQDILPAIATELLSAMVEGAMKAALKHPDEKKYLIRSVVRAMHAALNTAA